jgi:rhodanese-related sulfurtransferase
MAENKGFRELVAEAKKKVTEISPTDAEQKTKSSDVVIVDVREKDEFDEGHIPDAVHMSRGTIELEVEDKFPNRNTTIICHCGGGGRSGLAAESCKRWATKTSAPWPEASKPGKRPVYRRRNRRTAQAPRRRDQQLLCVHRKLVWRDYNS